MDAINQNGKIGIKVTESKTAVYVDIIDNGRGVKKTFFKEIFEPGFTSKKRGWGLGLSLVRRIIKDYHKGQVSLLKSIPNKETIIRIVLNK
jgi:two-component system, sporulation sensor kinase D